MDKPSDGFDDFEAFELRDTPTGETPRPTPRAKEPAPVRRAGRGGGGDEGGPPTGIPCPSCGTPNPPFNRHCDSCGARLSQAALPVAPQPMLRTTAGARALMVLAGVILTVALLALAVNVFRGGDGTAASSTTTSTTQAPLDIVQLRPIRAECTSELASYPCDALIDDDPDNSWNAREGGVGTVLTFLFSPSVQITEVFIYNLEDTERFERNARIKGLEILVDDLPQATIADLEDTNEPQRVQLRSLSTARLEITITSAYPGQSFEGKEPFKELAVQEILFYGRVAPTTGG